MRHRIGRAIWAIAGATAAFSLLGGGLSAAGAQEDGGAFRLELNGVQPSDKGCRITFVAANALGGQIDKASFEMALFDRTGAVTSLTVLDFVDLPQGKTKVLRFDLPGVDCTTLGRVLVNQAMECRGGGIDPSACLRRLDASSRTDIPFGL
jgi:hypothetical protein